MAIHQSAEDYLESILILQKRLGQVRSIDIVNGLLRHNIVNSIRRQML